MPSSRRSSTRRSARPADAPSPSHPLFVIRSERKVWDIAVSGLVGAADSFGRTGAQSISESRTAANVRGRSFASVDALISPEFDPNSGSDSLYDEAIVRYSITLKVTTPTVLSLAGVLDATKTNQARVFIDASTSPTGIYRLYCWVYGDSCNELPQDANLDVSFWVRAVPKPGTALHLGLGLAALARRRSGVVEDPGFPLTPSGRH